MKHQKKGGHGIWRLALRAVPSAVVLIFLLMHTRLFFDTFRLVNIGITVPLQNHRGILFAVLIALTVLSCIDGFLVSLWPREKTQEQAPGAARTACRFAMTAFWALVASAISFFEIELINNYYLYAMETRYVLLGIGLTFFLYLVAIFLVNSASVGLVIGNVFFLVWGMVNYFVQSFRGIPLQWIDFASIRTAMNVGGNYKYQLTWQIVACVVITGAFCGFALHRKSYHLFKRIPMKIASRGIGVAILICFSAVTMHTDFLANQGIWLRDWQPWYTYRLFGVESGFFAFARASYPQAPASYSKNHVASLIKSSEKNDKTEKQDGTVPENIICIMNESFSDLSIYPNFKASMDPMPFLNSVKENAQSGPLMVSVKGGTTANTEYEFLTGNSTVLSPTTVVYNSFIKQDQVSSLARILTRQGYEADALHPYYRNGWNREIVYPKMGFQNFFSIENAFQRSRYLRGFVSDEGDYDELISKVESKKKGQKLFLFNITMQNHSPYTFYDPEATVTLPDYNGVDKDKAEKYLTLIRYSDEALEKLIDYFKNSKEKTLICFWGDHQPEIGDDFWKYCLGKSLDRASFEEQQKTYETRYLIWANYDIPEKTGQTLSANYLSSYLLSLTGLKTTGYENFINSMRQSVPAMNAYGYLGTDGKQHQWGSSDAGKKESGLLDEYKNLIYNELTGGNDRDNTFFTGGMDK